MSTPDHARANFQTLLRAAADGNLANESTNDTDLLVRRVAELEPARSHVLLRLANFNTLLRAAARGDLALVECTDAMTGEPRYVLCAIAGDGDYVITPFGHLAPGNPTRPVSRR